MKTETAIAMFISSPKPHCPHSEGTQWILVE